MIINFIKKLLSYITELKVEQSSSIYNPLLMVTLKKGRYRLLTENAIYSYEDLYENFYTALEAINIRAVKIDEVLVLGLGLGSIPLMLEKNFKKDCFITAVELDEEVVRLASKYTFKRLRNPFDIICADASVFIQITEQQFDLICVDVFNDDKIPEAFYELDFLLTLRKALDTNGILLFNVLAYTDEDKVEAEAFFKTTFCQVFPEGGIVKTEHNHILVNSIKFL